MSTADSSAIPVMPSRPAAVLITFLAGAVLVSAQQATFRGTTDTVSLYATVVDHNGRLVPDLTKDDFQVFDDGKPQELTVFRNDVQPITIVVMLDRSGSMVGNFTIVRNAAEHFVADLLPADKARLGSFSERVEIDPPDFTSDVNDLIRILHYDLQDAGPTPLWNATFAAMNALEHQDGRRVVLVFTDGYDNPGRQSSGNVTLREVIERSQKEEMMVYAIGLADSCGFAPASAPSPAPAFQRRGGSGGMGGRPPGGGYPPRGWGGGGRCADEKPDPGLKVLADEGGGGYFELTRTADLDATFARVADELHHQYLLAFTTKTLDGKLHKLSISLRDPQLTARARKSYVAPLGK